MNTFSLLCSFHGYIVLSSRIQGSCLLWMFRISGESDRHGVKFYDDAVCKSFLLQCCPHEILSSTVSTKFKFYEFLGSLEAKIFESSFPKVVNFIFVHYILNDISKISLGIAVYFLNCIHIGTIFFLLCCSTYIHMVEWML